ncbi:hypothetical protein FH972_025954 [Carpinus fangiana]|uniref:Signal recognition particle subunit SRP72 n=1 Tax=Carpinus fangiana TaxID=176857 RepID=A0A5N6L2I4_9ROSI|nr:hypothetical protein FH972_025954 [Carpinus fangiana]
MSSLATLLSQAHLNDHDEILKQANAAIKKNKADIAAQHVRLVAYIKLDRYDDALHALTEGGDALKDRAPLEAAYTLYKSGRLREAADLAERHKEAKDILHVVAQTAYRAEDFEQARTVYERLASEGTVDDESDFRINSWAVDVQLGWVGKQAMAKKTRPDREDLDQFMATFNAACGYASRGELKQAEVLLQRAKDLCNATDLDEAEKKAELLPITVQQIYVLSRLGKLGEAEKLSDSIDARSISDLDTRHIAQSNALFATSKPGNPYIAHHLFQTTAKVPRKDLPFSYQSAALQSNALTLDLQAQKYKGVASSTLSTIRSQAERPASQEAVTAGAFNAAAHTHSSTSKTSIKDLLQLHASRPTDVGLLVTIIQLYVASNNHGAAIQAAENFIKHVESDATQLDLRFAPGLIGIITALYISQHRYGPAKVELNKAATHWRNQNRPDSNLLRAAGSALLDDASDTDLAAARELFQNMQSQRPGDPAAAAGIVAASTAAALPPRELLDSLPSVADLSRGIDAAALEEAGIPRTETSTIASTAVSRKRTAAITQPGTNATSNKRRSVRPSGKPKNFVEGKQMDPERWLPLKERSSYRPKGKKKGRLQQAQGATQGGEESPAGGSRPDTPSVVTGGSGGGGGGKAKKKKGKR